MTFQKQNGLQQSIQQTQGINKVGEFSTLMSQAPPPPSVTSLSADQSNLTSQIRHNKSSIRPPTTVMTSQIAPTANMTSQMNSNYSSNDTMPNMRSVTKVRPWSFQLRNILQKGNITETTCV